MFVHVSVVFLGVVLFTFTVTGVMAPWIIEWSIKTMEFQVFLTIIYYYYVVCFHFGLNKGGTADTSGRNECLFSGVWLPSHPGWSHMMWINQETKPCWMD